MKKPKKEKLIYYPESEITELIMMGDLSFDFPGMTRVSLPSVLNDILIGIGKEKFYEHVKPEQYGQLLKFDWLDDKSFNVMSDNCKLGTVYLDFKPEGIKAEFKAVTI